MCYSNNRMPPHLPPSLILLVAALVTVMGNPEVEESSSPYSCCEPIIHFGADCEYTWQINNVNFALTMTNDCIPPCVRIQDGAMTLNQCVTFDAIVVCTKQNVKVEQRIHYTNETCAGSGVARGVAPGNHGCVGSVLLVLLIGGWFVKHIC